MKLFAVIILLSMSTTTVTMHRYSAIKALLNFPQSPVIRKSAAPLDKTALQHEIEKLTKRNEKLLTRTAVGPLVLGITGSVIANNLDNLMGYMGTMGLTAGAVITIIKISTQKMQDNTITIEALKKSLRNLR